ncbi:MAG: hypothetical protein SF123_17605 [Chloroflexota bacterium]|nr:hypothetical protein [Chloroflexota bacterium]
MLNRLLLIVGVLLMAGVIIPTREVDAQNVSINQCSNTSGEFYQPDTAVRFDRIAGRLDVINLSSESILYVLADNLPEQTYPHGWSPNCRLFAVSTQMSISVEIKRIDGGSNGLAQFNRGMRLYDVVDRGVVGETAGGSSIRWSPNSDQAITYLRRNHLFFLWTRSGNQVAHLREALSPTITGDFQRYVSLAGGGSWDYARGWIWMSGHGGVLTYDLAGQVIRVLDNYNDTANRYRVQTTTGFLFSTDNSLVVLFGQRSELRYTAPALAVYDIASGQGVRLNPELNAAGIVALSADNRYLVMGYTALRVWDLQNVAPNFEDRLPFLRLAGTGGRIRAVRFIDTRIVEMETVTDVIIRYDVQTGARVDA